MYLAWNNGVQKTPAMGFNTWNYFACDISSTLIRGTASTMKTLGFLDAGYNFINIDDCWLTAERTASGTLQVDNTKFPEGMNNLTDYLHGLGFKAGIYEDEGTETCAGYSGSLNSETTDARSFVDWGFDYAKVNETYSQPFRDGKTDAPMKIDNCNSGSYSGTNQERFTRWHDAQVQVQNETGKTLFYSFVEWQSFDAWVWGPEVSNSWRIYDDIQANWPRITAILNNASFIGNYSNFWGHNDLDMLENGNGDLSLAEQRSHFTAWALNKSPLLIGTNFSALSNDSIEILLNSEIISINQDENIGEPLVPFFWGKNPDGTWDPDFPAQYWSDPSHTAIMYINFNPQTVDLNFTFSHSPHLKATSKYAVRDLWAHEDLPNLAGDGVDGYFFSGGVESHDVKAFLFTEV
ncbi:hypothetical protein HWV62_22740 [Athelia sp. TMB]|nr:hypothetical protein HWV62_22740 [Athelia sp. TMB]